MDRGWIKQWRKSLDSAIWKNHDLWRFWNYCLLKASHKKTKMMVGYQEVILLPGEFIFSRSMALKECGLSDRKIRTGLESLKMSQNVTIKTTSKFSVLSIINWDIYQGGENGNDQVNDQQATSKRPASDQQDVCIIIDNKNDKNGKNKDIPPKVSPPAGIKIGEFENITLSEAELKKLRSKFPDYQERIENLSAYLAKIGTKAAGKYKSHYATILCWGRSEAKKKPRSQRETEAILTFDEEG